MNFVTHPLVLAISFSKENAIQKLFFSLLSAMLLYVVGVSGVQAGMYQTAGYRQSELAMHLDVLDVGYRKAWLELLRNKAKQASDENEPYLANRLREILAQQGDSEAAFRLGLYYDSARRHERNARRAVYWYRRAALGGEIHAQHNLGVAYIKGDGIKMNISQAIRWWTLAARRGNADSQYNLGILYTSGVYGVKQDIEKAKHWWRKAAVHGDAMAQYNLGTLYVNNGVHDYCEAIRWWKEASRNGVERANLALRAIKSRGDYRACH